MRANQRREQPTSPGQHQVTTNGQKSRHTHSRIRSAPMEVHRAHVLDDLLRGAAFSTPAAVLVVAATGHGQRVLAGEENIFVLASRPTKPVTIGTFSWLQVGIEPGKGRKAEKKKQVGKTTPEKVEARRHGAVVKQHKEPKLRGTRTKGRHTPEQVDAA